MIYSPNGLMRYNDSNAIVDDMPLLSQWIKKNEAFASFFFGDLLCEKAYSKTEVFSKAIIILLSFLISLIKRQKN